MNDDDHSSCASVRSFLYALLSMGTGEVYPFIEELRMNLCSIVALFFVGRKGVCMLIERTIYMMNKQPTIEEEEH